MEINNITSVLAALAQESRLKVFKLLVQAGDAGLSAGKIAEMAGLPPSSLSFHLKELLHANMVTAKQDGRFIIYSANYITVQAVLQYLTENCCGFGREQQDACCSPLKEKP